MLTRAPIPTPEERAASLLESERLAERAARWSAVRTLAECWVWCAVGVYLIAWGMHVTDHRLGLVFFWGGLAVGNAGMLVALLRHYARAEARGDY